MSMDFSKWTKYGDIWYMGNTLYTAVASQYTEINWLDTRSHVNLCSGIPHYGKSA